jgi:hypothetical protein
LLFRIRIPQCLQPCLGHREYRRSLGRLSLSKAKGKALRLATVSLEIFQFVRMVLCARQGQQDTNLNADHEESSAMQGYAEDYAQYTSHLKDRPLTALSDEEIRTIADEWILAALQGANALRLQAERLRREALAKIDQQQRETPEQPEVQASQQSSPRQGAMAGNTPLTREQQRQ